MSQAELQRGLEERGLAKTGTKPVLAQRLAAALAEERSALLSGQVEARDELQRQYEEAAAKTGYRHGPAASHVFAFLRIQGTCMGACCWLQCHMRVGRATCAATANSGCLFRKQLMLQTLNILPRACRGKTQMP